MVGAHLAQPGKQMHHTKPPTKQMSSPIQSTQSEIRITFLILFSFHFPVLGLF